MESSNSKKNVPQLWYWSQPENGFSFEDAETIAKEFVFEAREDKSGDRFLHIQDLICSDNDIWNYLFSNLKK